MVVTENEVRKVCIKDIRIDQTRVEAMETTIFEDCDADNFQPIKVIYDGKFYWIINGHTRYRTAAKQGKKQMVVFIWKIIPHYSNIDFVQMKYLDKS